MKKTIYLFGSTIALLGLLTGCSNNHQDTAKSDETVKMTKIHKSSSKSKKKEHTEPSDSKTVDTNPNEEKQDKENNQEPDLSSISDRVIGVMAYAVARPNNNMADLGNGGFYYGTNYPEGDPIRGDSYINAGGNDEYDVWFKRSGNNVLVSILDTANASCNADAKIKTTTYSLADLVKKYYNTSEQKAQIYGYANALKDRVE